MTKRLFAILRYTMALAIIATAFTFVGCSDDDAGPTTFDGSIYAFITQDTYKQSVSGNADTALDSLVMYLEKFPDLKASLQSSTELTLFAPSNTAFKNLTALPGLKDPDQVNPDILKGVLAYHVVPGKKTSADMTAGAKLTTNFVAPGSTADVIEINGDGTLKTGSQNKAIVITEKDHMTTNGVVHITATVLIPNSTGNQLSAILGSLGATVLLGKDFTYMAYLIAKADAGLSPAETFTGAIASPTANATLFAVPNAVFNVLAGGSASVAKSDAEIKAAIDAAFTQQAARIILRNHLVTGKYTVATSSGTTQITNGLTKDAVSGKTLTFLTGVPVGTCQCPTGVVVTAPKTGGGTSQAPIFKADISVAAGINNGILQVVGGVITP